MIKCIFCNQEVPDNTEYWFTDNGETRAHTQCFVERQHRVMGKKEELK